MSQLDLAPWRVDWALGLPLIALAVIIHVCGLGLIGEHIPRILKARGRRRLTVMFVIVMGLASVLATSLHGIEAAIWAGVYLAVGALPDQKSALLYSLSAMTSYGHANLFLEDRWQLMGALEALTGMMLFGLTTAFLFAIIQTVWSIGNQGDPRT
jgi:MFS superfamily sulfate permease-like transporter